MINRPSRPEIEAQAALASEWMKGKTTAIYHSTFEEGVNAALTWVQGLGPEPIEQLYTTRFGTVAELQAEAATA